MSSDKIIEKNYGSIPHLSTSKLTQQADKKITLGQELLLTKKSRDWRDLIIVTEKIDGSNVGVVNKSGVFIPLTRSGYSAQSSPYSQHHYFRNFVSNNPSFFDWLPLDWRICGEWMLQAHGQIYDIRDFCPFVAFDIFDEHNRRIPYLDFTRICYKYGITEVPLLHIGQPIKIETAIKLLGKGHYGLTEKPEGVVYRMERENEVDFLAKWVRADKQDGKYILDGKETFNINTDHWRE